MDRKKDIDAKDIEKRSERQGKKLRKNIEKVRSEPKPSFLV